MKNDDILRNELLKLLCSNSAHVNFDEAVADIPKKSYGAPVEGQPYTLWRILQHMRISQKDILNYLINPNYQELVWPDDYWPQEKSPPRDAAWKNCIKAIRQDMQELSKIIENPKTKILESIPHIKNGPSILHEILLVVDHNAYHIGQIILLRTLLGIWND